MQKFFQREDCNTQYTIGEVLGTGSFAVVRKAVSKAEGSVWAVKVIEKAKLEKEDEEALKVEVAILESVRHPNIVTLRQVFDSPKIFYMVMELMVGGELFDRIVEKSKYSENEAAAVVRKLADALAYCHRSGIVHRDLKPENLLYVDTSEDSEIKIADFGLAKLIDKSEMMATACGTPGYVAPEVLEGRPYTEKVDCWSLGVILYILLCGFPPFYDENNAALFAQIKAGAFDFPSPYWDDVSDDAKGLVRQLLAVDPEKRLPAAAVLTHPWLTGGASAAPLPASVAAHLKQLNARRKFRDGVRKVMATNIFSKLSGRSLVQMTALRARKARVSGAAHRPLPGQAALLPAVARGESSPR